MDSRWCWSVHELVFEPSATMAGFNKSVLVIIQHRRLLADGILSDIQCFISPKEGKMLRRLLATAVVATLFAAGPVATAFAEEAAPADEVVSTTSDAEPTPEPAPELVEDAPAPDPAPGPEAEQPVAPVNDPIQPETSDQVDSAPELAPEPVKEEAAPVAQTEQPKKVWVCKYVGTPGTDERLQTGQNPISVSVNAIQHNQWDGNVPGWFSDAHDRSYVLSYDDGGPAPTAKDCPGSDNPEPCTVLDDRGYPLACPHGYADIVVCKTPVPQPPWLLRFLVTDPRWNDQFPDINIRVLNAAGQQIGVAHPVSPGSATYEVMLSDIPTRLTYIRLDAGSTAGAKIDVSVESWPSCEVPPFECPEEIGRASCRERVCMLV